MYPSFFSQNPDAGEDSDENNEYIHFEDLDEVDGIHLEDVEVVDDEDNMDTEDDIDDKEDVNDIDCEDDIDDVDTVNEKESVAYKLKNENCISCKSPYKNINGFTLRMDKKIESSCLHPSTIHSRSNSLSYEFYMKHAAEYDSLRRIHSARDLQSIHKPNPSPTQETKNHVTNMELANGVNVEVIPSNTSNSLIGNITPDRTINSESKYKNIVSSCWDLPKQQANWDTLLNPELFTIATESESNITSETKMRDNHLSIGQRIRLKYTRIKKSIKHESKSNSKQDLSKVEKLNLVLPEEVWLYNIIPYISSMSSLLALRLTSKSFNNILRDNSIWKSHIEARNGMLNSFEDIYFSMPSDEILSKDHHILLKEYIKFKKRQFMSQRKDQKWKTKRRRKNIRKKLQRSNLQLFLNPIGSKRIYHTFLTGMFWCSCLFYFSLRIWFFALVAIIPLILLLLNGIKFFLKYWKTHTSVAITGILLRLPLFIVLITFPGAVITYHFTKHPFWIVFLPLYFSWLIETLPLTGYLINRCMTALRAPKYLTIILNLMDVFCWVTYYFGIWGILLTGWMPIDLSISFAWLYIPLGIMQVTQCIQSVILIILLWRGNFERLVFYPTYWLILSTSTNLVLFAQEISFILRLYDVAATIMRVVYFILIPMVLFLPIVLTNSQNKIRQRSSRHHFLANFFRGAG